MSDWANNKITCVCGGSHTNKNKTQHIKTKKHLNYLKAQEQTPLALLKARLLEHVGEDVFAKMSYPLMTDEEHEYQDALEERTNDLEMSDDELNLYNQEADRLRISDWPVQKIEMIKHFEEVEQRWDKENERQKYDLVKVIKLMKKIDTLDEQIDYLLNRTKGFKHASAEEKEYNKNMPCLVYLWKLNRLKRHGNSLTKYELEYGSLI